MDEMHKRAVGEIRERPARELGERLVDELDFARCGNDVDERRQQIRARTKRKIVKDQRRFHLALFGATETRPGSVAQK